MLDAQESDVKRRDAALAIFLAVMTTACAGESRLRMSCSPIVPREFRNQPPELEPPPNGQPERVRYTVAYEAFWWNCVMLNAQDLKARCPLACSGTPAATHGCGDGSADAANRISDLRRGHSTADVQEYLNSIAATPEARRKIAPYFPNGPRSEKVSE
jgi:hypothetical protein